MGKKKNYQKDVAYRRKFNGVVFLAFGRASFHSRKTAAKKDADYERKHGNYARVIKTPGGYRVYIGKGKPKRRRRR